MVNERVGKKKEDKAWYDVVGDKISDGVGWVGKKAVQVKDWAVDNAGKVKSVAADVAAGAASVAATAGGAIGTGVLAPIAAPIAAAAGGIAGIAGGIATGAGALEAARDSGLVSGSKRR